MKHIKYLIAAGALAAVLFFLTSDNNQLDSCCPRRGVPPTPPPPAPKELPQGPSETPQEPPAPDAPKETPKEDAPKEAPTEDAPKKETPKETPKKTPDTPSQPAQPTPATPPPPAAPEQPGKTEAPPPPPPSTPSSPNDPPTSEGGGPAAKGGSTYVAPRATRPALGIGLQPLFQSIRFQSTSFVGVVEPWEVWWSNNRDRYISFREQIEWSKITDDGKGSKSVTVYPIYDELINVLAEGMSDKNTFVAFRAAISLGKVQDSLNLSAGSPKAIEQLKKAEESETRIFVRNNMLLALGFAGDTSTGELAKKVMLDKKKEIPLRRCYAALTIGYLPASPELSKVLKDALADRDDDHEVRCCAALALGNLKDASAIALLSKMLNLAEGGKKEHPAVRSYAALGLGRIGSKEALNELKKSSPTGEKEADVRTAVVIAMGMTGAPEAGDAITPFLRDRYPVVRGYAALALAQVKSPKAYELISELFRKEKFVEADGLMALALGLTGNDKAKADLRKVLENKKSRSPLFKAAAAIGLGLLKDREAGPLIISILSDEKQQSDTLLTPYLILSLGMIKDPKGAEVLKNLWEKLPEKSVTYPYHSNLAIALTMLGHKKDIVMPALLKQAKQTRDRLLRSYALHSLGLLGDRESAKIFIDAATDKDNPYVMYTTMSAIGFLMDKNQLNPISKVTGNLVDVSSQIMDHIGGIPVW